MILVKGDNRTYEIHKCPKCGHEFTDKEEKK
jgi:hypothetical protein